MLTLVLATAVLVIIPGPNVALIVANSVRYGTRMGAVTVLGTTAGVAIQLVMVVLGVAAVVEIAIDALVWIEPGTNQLKTSTRLALHRQCSGAAA